MTMYGYAFWGFDYFDYFEILTGISGKGKEGGGRGMDTLSGGNGGRQKKSSNAGGGGGGDPFSALRERVPRARADSEEMMPEMDEQRPEPEWN